MAKILEASKVLTTPANEVLYMEHDLCLSLTHSNKRIHTPVGAFSHILEINKTTCICF